ncbi:MAG: hypothetical protein K2W94_07950 [Alphaproteobacteria bacterium]|nr:hypothetical protein [Alphaproteobacteria bacterium]
MLLKLLAIILSIASSSFAQVESLDDNPSELYLLQNPARPTHKVKNAASRQIKSNTYVQTELQRKVNRLRSITSPSNFLKLLKRVSHQASITNINQEISTPVAEAPLLATETVTQSTRLVSAADENVTPPATDSYQTTQVAIINTSMPGTKKKEDHSTRTKPIPLKKYKAYTKIQRNHQEHQYTTEECLDEVTLEDIKQWRKEAYNWSRCFHLRNGWRIDRTPNSILISQNNKVIAKAGKAGIIRYANKKDLIINTDENGITIRQQHNLLLKQFMQLDQEMTELDFRFELMRLGLYEGTDEEKDAIETNCDWLDSETVYLRSRDPYEKSEEPIDYFTLAVWEGYSGTLYQEKNWQPLEIKFQHLHDRIYMQAFIKQEIKEFLGVLNNGKVLRLHYQMSRSEFLRAINQTGLMTERQRWPQIKKDCFVHNKPNIEAVKCSNGTIAYFVDLFNITNYIAEMVEQRIGTAQGL